jgi:hypothetical protein
VTRNDLGSDAIPFGPGRPPMFSGAVPPVGVNMLNI